MLTDKAGKLVEDTERSWLHLLWHTSKREEGKAKFLTKTSTSVNPSKLTLSFTL